MTRTILRSLFDRLGNTAAKWAACLLTTVSVGSAWGADPVTIQDASGNNISVYEVSSGFYQDAATYTASRDFYITSKAGLEYFRDLVNQVGTVADTYVTTYVNASWTAASWYTENIFTGKTVHLMTDVDLGNMEWSPIGQPTNAAGDKRCFYGNFDGEGHKVSNLKATTYTEAIKTWYPGLFGTVSGTQTFSDLTIENVTLVGYDYAGAVVGNAGSNATAFNNCHVTDAIDIKCMMTGAFVGGIVGIGTSAIDDCSVEGTAGSTIQGSTVGGLAGTSTRTAKENANTVTGSTVTGVTVKSEDNGGQAGGLVGKATNPVTVTGNAVHDVTVSAEAGKADVLVGGVGGDVTASSNTTDTNVTVISKPEVKLGSEDSAGKGMSLAELAASWGAAYANEVITLGQDVALDKRIYFYKDVTIDLNGHKLTLQAEASPGFFLDDGSIMVLKDSGTGGTFEHAYNGGIAIWVKTGSSLTFKNGIYNVGGNLTYNNGGTIAIESGVYTVGLSNVAIWTGSGKSTVSGGYFNVTRDTINWVVDGKLVEEVKEGQYAGYYLVRDIVDSDYVAENTTTGKRYLTLSDAMAEAKSGEVVQLIKTAVSGTLSFVPDGVVFNDNGFASTVISGAGTPSDPYLIKDIDLLKAFRNSVNAGSKFAGKYFKLTSDINLNNEEWTPIGDYYKEFCGVFDGDNHTISNLRVTAGGRSTYGLFGRVMKEDAESSNPAGIVNVTINNATVKSPAHWAGALAGEVHTGLAVENCHLKGDIDISVSSDGGYYAGGLVGKGGYVAYVDCSVKGNEGSKISGALYVGGIVAWHAEDSGIIKNCSVEGVSLNGQTWVGGIAGLAHYGSTVAECSVANINVAATDNGYAGQIVGLSLGKAGSLTTVVDNTVAAKSVVVTAGGEEVAVQIGTENNPYTIVGWDVEKDTDGKVVGGTFERLATEALADGYILSEPNAQGLYTVEKEPVAQIGANKYETLADAIAAAQDGDTVQLLKDCETGSQYTLANPLVLTADNVTLDLKGKTITATNNFSFLIGGDNDVVKNGTIQAGANAGKQTGINSYAIVVNGCDGVTLTGLTVNGGISIGGSTGETPNAAAATNVVIEDCTVTSGDFYAVCAQQNSTVTITSGTYTADPRSTYSGVIQGTFEGTDGPKGTISVTGGTFNGKITNNNEGDIVISGGNFSAQVLEKYCAEDYVPTTEPVLIDNVPYYTVQTLGVAKIARTGETTQYFSTLAAAISAAQDGDTIEMIADVTGENVTVAKSVTITVAEGESQPVLTDTAIVLADGSDVALLNLAFRGDSVVDATAVTASITMKNCDVDVMVNAERHNLGRKAFLIADNNSTKRLSLDIENNVFVVNSNSDYWRSAIFSWVPFADGSVIKDNVFGSADSRFHWMAIKFMNIVDEATLRLEGNTFYGDDGNDLDAVVFDPVNTSSLSASIISVDNVIDGVRTSNTLYAFQIGKSGIHVWDCGTTINGVPLTIANFENRGGANALYGVGVTFDNSGMMTAGTFNRAFSDEELAEFAAEGLRSFAVGDGTYTLDVPVAQIGDVKYASFEKAIADVQDGETIVVLGYNAETMVAPEGWTFATEDDVTTLVRKAYVAQIGATKYETLAAAVEAAQAGDTVQLIADCETGATYTHANPLVFNTANATLDLNGKTLTITYNMSLVFRCSNGVVKNGTIVPGVTDSNVSGDWCRYGLTIDNCTGVKVSDVVSTTGIAVGGDPDDNYTPGAGPATDVVFERCTVTGRSTRYAVFAQNQSTATIKDGTYSAYTANGNVLYSGFKPNDGGAGSLTVLGGSFTGAIPDSNIGAIVISGGIFSKQPVAGLLAQGYLVVANEDAATKVAYPYMVALGNNVTFELGESAPTGAAKPSDGAFAVGTALPLPTYTSTDTTFAGWKVAGAGDAIMVLPAGMTGDIMLVATWTTVRTIQVDTSSTEVPVLKDIKVTDEWLTNKVDAVNSGNVAAVTSNEELKAAVTNKLMSVENNGLKGWENYVLGLDGSDPNANVAADAAQGPVSATPITSNVEVPKVDTGFKVEYKLVSVDTNGTTVAEIDTQATPDLKADIASMTSETNVVYYKTVAVIKSTDPNKDVTVEVPSTNTIGVLKVASAPKTAMIAVPWAALDGDGDISAANLVRTANLTEGDELHYYKDGKFQSWTLGANGTWQSTKNVSDSGTTDGDAASDAKIPRGSAVWLKRQDASKPVYLVGEVGTGTAKTALEGGTENAPAWNMVASPSVEAVDVTKKVDAVAGDRIVIPTDGAPKNYTFKDGKWGYNKTEKVTINGQVGIRSVRVVVDALESTPGVGFWYLNAGTAKNVDWTSENDQGADAN